MQANSRQHSSPKTLMQAYRQAYNSALQNPKPEETIKAYSKVIEFCANTKSCRWQPNVKRNVLLFWAHNNIAQALGEQERYLEALKYWKKSLYLAATNRQKADVLEKMLTAWEFAPVSISERCSQIINVSGKLSKIYMQEGRLDEVVRLERLKEKVSQLVNKAGS